MKYLLALIKAFFGSKPSVNPQLPINIPTPPKKIAIIIGHGNGDSGALGWNKVEEYSYNFKVAEIIKANCKKDIMLFYRTSTGIIGAATRVVAWGPDISIELHCNAYNGQVSGCEVLCLAEDKSSEILGKSFAKEFTEKFKRKLRGDEGIKHIGPKDRGYTSLKAVSPIAQSILVEPFFIDSEAEWIDQTEYGEWFAGWINEL